MKYTCEINEELQNELNKSYKQKCLIFIFVGIIGLLSYIFIPFESILLEILLYTSSCIFGISLVLLININKTSKKAISMNITGEYELEKNLFNSYAVKDGEQISSIKIYYKDLVKIKETENYLFLYPNKQQAYPVPKSKLTKDELTTLKVWLKKENNKYNLKEKQKN